MKIKYFIGLVLSLAVLQMSGCGKKSSSTPAPVVTQPTSTTAIIGVVTKGPIAGATVQAFAIRSDVTDTVPLGQGKTDGKGNYTIETFGYKGPIVVEATGGSYNDEIFLTQPITLKTPLRAMFSSVQTTTTTIVVSPLTELAAKLAEGQPVLTGDAIDAANRSIASAFSTTSYTVTNIISSVPNKSSVDANETGYAAALTAFSQLIIDSVRVNDLAPGAPSLDDALATVMKTLGDELTQTGGFSFTSLGFIEQAQQLALNGGTTTPPSGTPPPPTPPNGIIKFSTAGTPTPADTLKGIIFTLTLPAGVTVDTGVGSNDAAGTSVFKTPDTKTRTLAALVTAATATLPGSIAIQLQDAKGIAIGPFLTINFHMDTTKPFPTLPGGDFGGTNITNVNIQGLKLVTLTGVNVVPTSLSGF